MSSDSEQPRPAAIAIDIGSTIVKIARLDAQRRRLAQTQAPRDFDAGIAKQVELLLQQAGADEATELLICSSANGGLRIGIVALTPLFSGAELFNQALLAGANPVFVHTLGENKGDSRAVDLLLIGGGIDNADAAPLSAALQRFTPDNYRYGALVYAGNGHLAEQFKQRFPAGTVIANPLANTLRSRSATVFEALRRAYLNDLVHKEGVSELGSRLSSGIRPTPEVVSRGFERAVSNQSDIDVAGPSLLLDVGGATTDIHYTVELTRDDSPNKSSASLSIARYVFTDLGVVASRDSTLLQLRSHPRTYDLLSRVLEHGELHDTYQSLREGEHQPGQELLAYACLFFALDRFAQGQGPGLPSADLGKLSQIILTGGATMGLAEAKVAAVVDMLLSEGSGTPKIMLDRHYQVWVDGITWSHHPIS